LGPVKPRLLPVALRLLALALAGTARARAGLWVSPSGNDRDPGTEEAPFRTIEHARDVVRTMNQAMTDDITVFLAGEFRVAVPIQFGPADAGSNGYNIIYTAAPDAHPVVTGAYHVTGWSVADSGSGLWSAPAPEGLADAHDLFVNGSPVRRTRGRLLQVFARNLGPDQAAASQGEAKWKNLGDVIFEPARPGAIWSELGGTPPFFVQNAYEFIGTPGEWYFDRPARRIYYTPRPGETLATADVEAAAAQALIVAQGTADHPVAGIIFKGIRFEGTTQLDPWAAPAAALRFTYAGGIQFLEDEFLHMGTPALAFGPAFEGGTVDGCLFADLAGSALAVTGAAQVRVSESRLSYTALRHGADGVIRVAASKGVSIDHCQLDHYPLVAVLRAGAADNEVTEESNQVLPPMISMHGVPSFASGEAAEGEVGVPAAYQSLLDEKFAAPTIPDPPDDVSAEAEDEFAYVTWMPSCLDGGSAVGSYLIACSNGSKSMITATDFLEKGYVVFGDLQNGHAYTFTVTAVNAQGSGPASLPTAPVQPLRKRKLKTPPEPASVSVTPAGTALRVRIVPGRDGGGPIVAYAVTSAPDGARNLLEGLDIIHADATHPIVRRLDGFPPEQSTSVSITAANAAGEGDPAVVKLR
jgi:hypothetical protein